MRLNFNNIESLKENHFKGFISIKELWSNQDIIPKTMGVYLILNPNLNNIKFIKKGVGGFFKNKNPNVSIDILTKEFVPNSLVIYIGKAGSKNNKSTVHSRLKQYLKFGQGKKTGHWGGRLIWQLENYKDLLVCWKTIENEEPREIEKKLILEYKKEFERLPFSNLSH